ncbi:MAG: 4-hydroxy-3-methylbut-2-enyl diphosphate reductase [Candidatus Poribacteria bacterium]|nr:4-hydroxy-3-methylbut-2-enyl diphosphate reductase [Candidatus Poribacteria bacterium]
MARKFDVPDFYRSPIISVVKNFRRAEDPRKRDLAPSILDFGPVRFKIGRHFGFCFGVENAIEIAYKALTQHPNQRIFLLSEIIHNSHVNADLQRRGVRFICETSGKQLIPFEELCPDDVVIVPAFGTTIEVEQALNERGILPYQYNTTCPFVEKVWKKSSQISKENYSVIIHGKWNHEETRATFSHSKEESAVLVVRDLEEAEKLANVIRGNASNEFFYRHFENRISEGFNPETHLRKIGVVNQTTMLATETQAIATLLKKAIIDRYGEDQADEHFADTRDTLCYATKENQDATLSLIADGADLAIIVGGYNSSNTSHLVALCESSLPTYFISDAGEIHSPEKIRHLDNMNKQLVETQNWLPTSNPTDIILTAGASCPDALLDEVLQKIVPWFPGSYSTETVLHPYTLETVDLSVQGIRSQ